MFTRSKLLPSLVVAGLVGSLACSTGPGEASSTEPQGSMPMPVPNPGGEGGLVAVSLNSEVGVLLDEVPANIRDRVAAAYAAKPAQFWKDRALTQVRLSNYRLVFREYFYGWNGGYKHQLPLPPENIWNFTLTGAATRKTVNGHDLVTVPYTFKSTVLTDKDSPGVSENKLQQIGGVWNEPFIYPIDPELLYQRTGYACMDEADFPVDTVTSEEVDTYYDHTCGVEKELNSILCHQTELPTMTCVEALDAYVGKVSTEMRFERLPWDKTLADSVRVYPATTTTPDLEVYLEDFRQNRLEYKYFAPGSCELNERCVGAPGWRRVLQFNSSDQNRGKSTLEIGSVDYYYTGKEPLNQTYHIFEDDQCHKHHHFTHYGQFSFDAPGANKNNKQGFCLQSTLRTANNENSPLPNPYGGCDFQGVEAGWADQYKIGLPCQWVDVTDVDTSTKPVTGNLGFTSNPDGFVCEGTWLHDPKTGDPLFEPTSFTTAAGETVWRPMCDETPGAELNNKDSYAVTIPTKGKTFVNDACTRGQVGPLRNCGWQLAQEKLTCTPGATVTVRCTVAAGNAPQAARICERSAKLNTSMACIERYALASESVITTKDLQVTCPVARPDGEPGGQISIFTGAVFPEDRTAGLSCTIL